MSNPMDLRLGDRVRVNETCEYQELIGSELFVCGLTMRPDMTANICLSDYWPPRKGGSDEWLASELDKLP